MYAFVSHVHFYIVQTLHFSMYEFANPLINVQILYMYVKYIHNVNTTYVYNTLIL